MKKIIVIPDSFKGTLSSADAGNIARTEIEAVFPDCTVVCVPVADGGEGSVDCFLAALGGEKPEKLVAGPFFERITAHYGILPDGVTAVIEMAACAGLPLAGDRKNPLLTTTYGVGELILDSVSRGCRNIIIGLGGSSTNDAGCGMAAALGYIFTDKNGKSFVPTGGTLADVRRIGGRPDPRLSDISITTMCDIDNVLYGNGGAAHIFAPQKGADTAAVELLDSGLRHIADLMRRDLGIDVGSLSGGGAAGGMGAGMAAFLGSPLLPGIDVVLDAVAFDDLLRDADLVITGEGKLDSQSLRGKTVIGIARRASPAGVPVIAVVGGYDENLSPAYSVGVTAVFSINRLPEDLSVSAPKTKQNFSLTLRNILRLLSVRRV